MVFPASSGNLFNDLVPKLMYGFLEPISNESPFIASCDRRYEELAKQQGDKITITVSQDLAVRDVVPSITPAEAPPVRPLNVELSLDYWKEIPMTFSDGEVKAILAGTVPNTLRQAGFNMRDAVETSLANTYKECPNIVGVPGTTPFAANPDIIADAGLSLNREKVFQNDRALIIDPFAHAKASVLPAFRDVSQAGDAMTLREGYLGRKFGFDISMGQLIPFHVAGSAASWVTPALPVGSTSAVLTGGTGTFNVGDIFSVAGSTQTHTVVTATAGNITFFPANKVAWTAGLAVSVRPSHTVNMAFQKEAIALVTANTIDPLAEITNVQIQRFTEPKTGLSFALEFQRQNYQTVIKVSCLWGVKMVRRLFACRVAG